MPTDTAPPIPLFPSSRGRHTGGMEQDFGFGGRQGQGQGHRQQSMELPQMQNSFSQLLPRALVLFWTSVPLARIRCATGASSCSTVAPLTSPSAPFGSIHQILDPSTGKQHGSVCSAWHRDFPPRKPFGLSRMWLRCFAGRHRFQPQAGAGHRSFPAAKPRANQPSAQRAGSSPHHADTHRG